MDPHSDTSTVILTLVAVAAVIVNTNKIEQQLIEQSPSCGKEENLFTDY